MQNDDPPASNLLYLVRYFLIAIWNKKGNGEKEMEKCYDDHDHDVWLRRPASEPLSEQLKEI